CARRFCSLQTLQLQDIVRISSQVSYDNYGSLECVTGIPSALGRIARLRNPLVPEPSRCASPARTKHSDRAHFRCTRTKVSLFASIHSKMSDVNYAIVSSSPWH